MTEMDVITKVQEPTEWAISMVCIAKNRDLRICIDPGDLNANTKRRHCEIPKCDEIISKMVGAQFFSKPDAAHGFWQ